MDLLIGYGVSQPLGDGRRRKTSGGEQLTTVKGNDQGFRERSLGSDFFVRSELQLNIPRRTSLCPPCNIPFERDDAFCVFSRADFTFS